jgi:hypothetical protein
MYLGEGMQGVTAISDAPPHFLRLFVRPARFLLSFDELTSHK